jgi:hypothetical protein
MNSDFIQLVIPLILCTEINVSIHVTRLICAHTHVAQ